jgi:hypothetical protein
MQQITRFALAAALSLLIGCSSEETAPLDGGSDSGARDAAPPANDAALEDSGELDAGDARDAQADDARADAGRADTGALADSGPPPDGGGGPIALNDLGAGGYLGFTGGLYPNGANDIPAAHFAEGIARAQAIEPLDTGGNPSPNGKAVLLSIGMSNTTQEFCSGSGNLPCSNWSFVGQAAMSAGLNTELTLANGAFPARPAFSWDSPTDTEYDRVRDDVLGAQGLSEAQVQIVWIKVANPRPTMSLPGPQADAYALERSLGDILRAVKTRYPNIQQAFLSSRIYAGYATVDLNPEPYAYESGFSVKWVIEAQIAQMATGSIDSEAGDLDYNSSAPWIAWGPYLWADGLNARSDGLTWAQNELAPDGTHPSMLGQQKVGRMLLEFFSTSPVARCWFLAAATCP